MQTGLTILKKPELDSSLDYAYLRTKGMEYIEELGSSQWTDYNIHDPGITLLELFCYALTDLGYRTSLPIEDLLAVPMNQTADHERQGFFPAHKILTVNPWTNKDFRKLLIDIPGVKNGWLRCKECACNDITLYANCGESKLQYESTLHPVVISGLYDVMIEFDDTERTGDLNSGKIRYNFQFPGESGFTTGIIELRLPSWQQWEHLETLSTDNKYFRSPRTTIKAVRVLHIAGNKEDNINIPVSVLASVLRRQVFVTMEIDFQQNNAGDVKTLRLVDIPMNVWFDSDGDRKAVKLPVIAAAIANIDPSGIFPKYLEKLKEADRVINKTKKTLHAHRNLCEDYCTIKAVQVQDIAICTDMEVDPSVDIEAIVAEAYYIIDQYFSPEIPFYSLKQLLEKSIPVDEIFDGPLLENGFINDAELEASGLKKFLYASDVINLLMDIPGVKAIRNFAFLPYDDEGRALTPEPWKVAVAYNHQPKLYMEASKFLVYKNNLTFIPNRAELLDTIPVIRAQHNKPKFSGFTNKLSQPEGKWQDLNDYYPLQYSLPITYGVGPDGIPGTISEARVAQSKQLKAYLLFFEQLLVNYLSQLSKIKELYSIDEYVSETYFSRLLSNTDIQDVESFYSDLNSDVLQGLIEQQPGFLNRRNRFLDQLLGRFAESFNDYALMLYSYAEQKKLADARLIINKVKFLRDLPSMSRDRGRAFNYKDPLQVCDAFNAAGLKQRIERLLGIASFEDHFELYEESDTDNVSFEKRWRLKDETGKIYLSSSTRYTGDTQQEADEKALAEIRQVRKYIADINRYEIKEGIKFTINLLDTTGEVIATRKHPFETKALAEAALAKIIEYGKKILSEEKIFIVEHLLLRPLYKKGSAAVPAGDPLLSVCIPDDCSACGEEDPYSFRFTIVLNGESGIANSGIEFRRFAEKTIREQAPAHLGLKTCWVSEKQMSDFEGKWCAWLAEKAKDEPNPTVLSTKLGELLLEFEQLKSIYPKAYLHDCADGNDENRVFLGQTVI